MPGNQRETFLEVRMSRPAYGVAVAVAVAVVTLLGGCSDHTSSQQQEIPGDVFVGHGSGEDDHSAGDSALLEGELGSRDGCLVVITDDSTVFPVLDPAEIESSSEGLRLFGRTVHAGDRAHLTGGFGDDVSQDELPDECADLVGSRTFHVFTGRIETP